ERSEAIQSHLRNSGLLRRYAPRNDGICSLRQLRRHSPEPPDCAGFRHRSMCASRRRKRRRRCNHGSPDTAMSHLDPFLLTIAAIFLFAGFIKGVIGLGLPTVSVSLLAVTM